METNVWGTQNRVAGAQGGLKKTAAKEDEADLVDVAVVTLAAANAGAFGHANRREPAVTIGFLATG